MQNSTLLKNFKSIRDKTEQLSSGLNTEDYSIQIAEFASPVKWHLAHTTWFFEAFILTEYVEDYKVFDSKFNMLFNSYYENKGDRIKRVNRGNLSHPPISKVLEYREYVNYNISKLLEKTQNDKTHFLINLGLNHEQQHQELMLSDLKYLYANNPLYPKYVHASDFNESGKPVKIEFLSIEEDVYQIGYKGKGFFYDNEKEVHKKYIHKCKIANRLVTNGEYLEFVESSAYNNPNYWLSDGWDWKNANDIKSPLYWEQIDGSWHYYTLSGLRNLDKNIPVSHISFYEADAYARWKECRLPTEFEWEVACKKYSEKSGNLLESELYSPGPGLANDFIGNLWEWTSSAYLPYPMYKQDEGALGEYNGKFMVNQKVLRGGSYATPKSHIRPEYRNFYHPNMRWMFSGIRLAKDN